MKVSVPFLLWIAMFYSLSATGQSGLNEVWRATIADTTGNKGAALYDVAVDASGNQYACGFTTSGSNADFYVVKYDQNGNVVWEDVLDLDPNRNSEALQVALDGSGNLYVHGIEGEDHAEHEAIVIKYDASGNRAWQTVYDSPDGDEASFHDMKITASGLFLAGYRTGAVIDEVGLAVKIDPATGNIVWSSAFDPGSRSAFNALDVDGSGNLIACGYSESEDSYLVVKFDGNGNESWHWPNPIPQFSRDSIFHDIVITPNGDIYCTGGEDDFPNSDRAVLYKFDASGNFQWADKYTFGGFCTGREVFVHPNGNIYMYADLHDAIPDYHVGLVEYTPAGTRVNVSAHTLTGYVENYDMTMDVAGNFYATGWDDGGSADSVFVMKIDASGQLVWKTTWVEYSYNPVSVAANANHVATAGYNFATKKGSHSALNQTTGSEIYRKEVSGQPLHYSRVGDVSANDQNTWVGTYATNNDGGSITIGRYDASGNLIWEAKRAEVDMAGFPCIAHDNNGNVYGWYYFQPINAINHAALVKYDANGQFQWRDTIIDHQPTDIVIDASGNSYSASFSKGSMILIKYDPSGNQVWEKSYTSSGNYTFPVKMVLSSQDKLVILARSRESGDIDLSVFQYDLDGTLEWNQEMDVQTGGLVYPTDIIVQNNGDITALGYGGSDWTLVRYDNTGSELWKKNIINGTSEFGRAISLDNSGNLYVASFSSGDYIVRKYDNAGNELLNKTFASTESSPPEFIWATGNHVLVAGNTVEGFTATAQFIATLDPSLNLLNTAIDTTTANFRFVSFAQAGSTKVAAVSHRYASTPAGQWYETLAQQFTTGPVGLELVENDKNLHIYPNPVKAGSEIIIETKGLGDIQQYKLLDAMGRLILQSSVKQLESEVRLQVPAGIASGLYFFELAGKSDVSAIRGKLQVH